MDGRLLAVSGAQTCRGKLGKASGLLLYGLIIVGTGMGRHRQPAHEIDGNVKVHRAVFKIFRLCVLCPPLRLQPRLARSIPVATLTLYL
jgi:hypothetical protein